MTSLPSARLAGSGMHITRIGIGAWAFGGASWVDTWGAQSDADSEAAVLAAVDRGLNWIDTAPIYGLGHSEDVVGRALNQIPAADRPYVFTKAGVIGDRQRPHDKPALVGAPASIQAELDASLRRLGVDHVDLYQMHAPPADGTPIEEYWQVFCDLRREGKVRAIGMSNHNVAQLTAAEAVGHVDAVQPKLNLIHRESADVIDWSAAHGAGTIVYSPMASGLLTGAFSTGRVAALPSDDWRRQHPDFAGRALERNLALVDALRPVAERHGVTVAAVAVAWVLAVPGVTGAIVGIRRPGQLDDWATSADLNLDESDLSEIATSIERTGTGSGPARLTA